MTGVTKRRGRAQAVIARIPDLFGGVVEYLACGHCVPLAQDTHREGSARHLPPPISRRRCPECPVHREAYWRARQEARKAKS